MDSHIDLQELGAILVTYGEVDDPAMRHFNPSIAWHEGKLRIAIRSCNFAVEWHGKWYLRDGNAYSKTDVLYGDLDPDTLQVSNLTKLELSRDTPLITKLAGLEDVRLFSREKGMYAIGFESDRITRSLHNASATMAEYVIKGNQLVYIRTLQKPDDKWPEKNWQPTDFPSVHFDFTYSPTQVWKSGKVLGEKYTGQVHGGSQLLQQKDGTYLSIVHEKKLDPKFGRLNHHVYDKYVYFTYLAKHNKYGIITERSKPFRFGTYENIEFASGLVEYKDNLLISLGIRDCKYAIARIKKDKLMALFS